jgi:biopolymer transport protein ExbD
MTGMRKYKIKKFDMEINIAPLVDIIFLLLLFFMLASTLDKNEIRATIQLPLAEEGQTSGEKDKSIVLCLDKNGMVYAGKSHISWDILPYYLKENYKDFSDGIKVYADKEVDFEYIVKMMAVGTRLGIDTVSFLLEHEYLD